MGTPHYVQRSQPPHTIFRVVNAKNAGHAVHAVRSVTGLQDLRPAPGALPDRDIAGVTTIDAATLDAPAAAEQSVRLQDATLEQLQEAIRRGTFRAHVRFALWALLIWFIAGFVYLIAWLSLPSAAT